MSVEDAGAALAELGRVRRGRVVVYVADQIDTGDAYALYDCLRGGPRTGPLDLVLWTGGGDVDVTRRIGLLLHDFCDRLRILVPDRARSAGTLLCLAAHELVLGPMAGLGPIDGHLTATTDRGRISCEDVRALPEMAADWFGLDTADAGRDAFDAVGRHVFPPTLGAFYRAASAVRRSAADLLRYQRPDLDDEGRYRIVDQFTGGFGSHGYVITRAEARAAGLMVTEPSPHEEDLMWQCADLLHRRYVDAADDEVSGLIAGTDGFRATRTWTGPMPPVPGAQPPRPYWSCSRPALSLAKGSP